MNYLVEQATQTAHGLYAYIAPNYTQVKRVAWDALKMACRADGVRFNEAELVAILPNGARVQLFGAENYDALRGMHLNGAVLDEYAQIESEAWGQVIGPALAMKQGFAIFIGTPKGRNQFYDIYRQAQRDPDWFHALYTYQDSHVFEEAGIPEEPESARRRMTPEEFAQEYECSFEAAIVGAYYAPQFAEARRNGRFRELVWEPTVPVETWWDLGFTDATAIIFTQTMAREVRVIDYLEASGHDLAHYVKRLSERPYVYGAHHLPHDAGHKTQGGAGVTIEQQLRKLGLAQTRVHGKGEVLPGINQARLLFPRCWFDAVKAERLLTCLASYHSKGDDSREPQHDEFSHGADAFRLLAMGHKDADGHRWPSQRLPKQRTYDTSYNPWDRVGETKTRRAIIGGTAWDV